MIKKIKTTYTDLHNAPTDVPSLFDATQKQVGTPVVPEEQVKKIAEQVVEEKLKEQDSTDVKKIVAAKNEEQKIHNLNKVQQIIASSPRTLYTAKAVFPFDLFPDEIRIEESKVNIISKNFFASAQVQTQSFKDIKKVEVETSIIFAKLRLVSWTPVDSTLEISFLKKDEALKARRIIEGLKTLSEQKVDFSKIPTYELIEQVEHLGSVK